MQIESGHYYKTWDGRTVGPMIPVKNNILGDVFRTYDTGRTVWFRSGSVGRVLWGDPTDDLIAPAYPEQGTLKEIGAKVGDVVEMLSGDGAGEHLNKTHTIQNDGRVLLDDSVYYWGHLQDTEEDGEFGSWRIISRAPESPTSPIRTVTRTTKEIVPGVYGAVEVYNIDDGDQIGVTMDCGMSPAELRVAAITLNEIADALESA